MLRLVAPVASLPTPVACAAGVLPLAACWICEAVMEAARLDKTSLSMAAVALRGSAACARGEGGGGGAGKSAPEGDARALWRKGRPGDGGVTTRVARSVQCGDRPRRTVQYRLWLGRLFL